MHTYYLACDFIGIEPKVDVEFGQYYHKSAGNELGKKQQDCVEEENQDSPFIDAPQLPSTNCASPSQDFNEDSHSQDNSVLNNMNENDNANFNGLTLLCKGIEGVGKSDTSFIEAPSKGVSKCTTSFTSANKHFSAKKSYESQIKKMSS